MRVDRPTLSLSAEQKRQLLSLEEASFSRYCRAIGCKPQQHQELLLSQMKHEAETLVAKFDENMGIPSSHAKGELRKKIQSSTDFWEVIRLVARINQEGLISEIVDLAPRLPIEYAYLSGLADIQELPQPSPEKPESLRDALLSIPAINLFDMEFNAFVRKESLLGDIPCVCVYTQLLTAVAGMTDILLPAVLSYRTDGSADPATESETEQRSRDSAFMNACRTSFQMVFCESDRIFLEATARPRLLSQASTEGFVRHRMITDGAQNFVLWHEYGHLTMGHLQLEPCHRLEFEADRFAAVLTVLSKEMGPNEYYWRYVGVLCLFVLLMILEAKAGNPVYQSHPPASVRLERLLATPVMRTLACRLVSACNPTLEKWWDFTIGPNIS